jgi:hypothetical protein
MPSVERQGFHLEVVVIVVRQSFHLEVVVIVVRQGMDFPVSAGLILVFAIARSLPGLAMDISVPVIVGV